MLLFGCLLAFVAAFAPRVVLIIAWLFNADDRWNRVWGGNWFWPLLGIIFLPYTTIMYMLVWQPTGITGWAWMWIGLGVLLDIMKWAQIVNNRRGVPGYPKGTTTSPTMAAPVGTTSQLSPMTYEPAAAPPSTTGTTGTTGTTSTAPPGVD